MALEIKIARAIDELNEVFKIRYGVFGKEKDYIDISNYKDEKEYDEYDSSELATNFIAIKDGIAVGTIRIIEDSGLHFQIDHFYDLSRFRKENRKLAEGSRYSVLRDYRNNPTIALGLFKIAYNFAVRRGATDLFLCANTNTLRNGKDITKLYKKIGFCPLREAFYYEKFNEYAVPMHLEVSKTNKPFKNIFNTACNYIEKPYDTTSCNSNSTANHIENFHDVEYGKFFSRNLGILTRHEQEKLRNSNIAVAGVGGVGGIQAVMLARTGISAFNIADPEVYGESDINRQYGATTETIGKKKVDVIEQILKSINPELKIRKFQRGINKQDISDFLFGADLMIDAIEYFALDEKIILHRAAREKGIYAITSPVIGYGSSMFVFSPHGMSFEEFFKIPADEDKKKNYKLPYERLCPVRPDYLVPDPYIEASKGKIPIPSLGPSTALSASLVANEALFILLNKREPIIAPKCIQVDHFKNMYVVADFSSEQPAFHEKSLEEVISK